MDNATGAAGLVGFAIAAALAFAVFLVTREVWCWYWKINTAVQELGWIRAELQKLNAREEKKTQGYQGEFAPK